MYDVTCTLFILIIKEKINMNQKLLRSTSHKLESEIAMFKDKKDVQKYIIESKKLIDNYIQVSYLFDMELSPFIKVCDEKMISTLFSMAIYEFKEIYPLAMDKLSGVYDNKWSMNTLTNNVHMLIEDAFSMISRDLESSSDKVTDTEIKKCLRANKVYNKSSIYVSLGMLEGIVHDIDRFSDKPVLDLGTRFYLESASYIINGFISVVKMTNNTYFGSSKNVDFYLKAEALIDPYFDFFKTAYKENTIYEEKNVNVAEWHKTDKDLHSIIDEVHIAMDKINEYMNNYEKLQESEMEE